MARPKSDILKAFGTAFEFFKAIVDEVLTLEGNDDSIRRVLSDKKLRRQIAELIVGSVEKVAMATTQSLASMIAAGKYDWINSDITEARFPMPEPLVLGTEPKLYHFNRNISSEKAIEEMAKDGYRPATIWDLLDYGTKNPEVQMQFPIVALGSVAMVGGGRCVACLSWCDSGRGLFLYWFDGGWGGVCRFLAVRKN